jgi:hypothetical protein
VKPEPPPKTDLEKCLDIIKQVAQRKFPKGERAWCVECANRMAKEIVKKINKIENTEGQ